MVEAWEMDETELLEATEALRNVSLEQRRAVILKLEEGHPGIVGRAKELLVGQNEAELWNVEATALKPIAEPPKIVEQAKVKLIKRHGIWWQADGKRWNGPPPKSPPKTVPQLKVVDQVKPEPKPEEEEPKKAAQAEPKKTLTVVPPVPALPPELDDALAAMNRQHAIIENVGGKAVIASWEPSTYDTGRLMVIFQNKESLLLRYSNRSIPIEVPSGKPGISAVVRMPLAQWWLTHRGRQQYRGITFRPGGPTVMSECLNLWQGWGVEPKEGDWSLIEQHIYEVIAGGNREFGDYVINWNAWAIQHPDQQAEAALVLIGPKGVGKGTLVRCLQRIFGAPN